MSNKIVNSIFIVQRCGPLSRWPFIANRIRLQAFLILERVSSLPQASPIPVVLAFTHVYFSEDYFHALFVFFDRESL